MDFKKLLLKKIVDVAKEYLDTPKESAPAARQVRPKEEPVYEPEEIQRTPAEWIAYFKEILLSEFSSYSIRENVPVTDLAGFANDEFQLYTTRPKQAYKAEWGKPYTFVLEKDSKPIATVMLGDGHTHDSNVKYLIARMYAKKMELPYINFYTQMPNERGYVVERISKFLN